MKKLISIILFSVFFVSFFTSSICAQEVKPQEFNNKKTEVNIAVSNLFAKNNLVYPYYYYELNGDYYLDFYLGEYYPRPELFVGVKFHNTKGAVRLGANFNYSHMKNEEKNGGDNIYTIAGFGTKLNLGYEWHLTYSRVNIYYGLDLSTALSNARSESENDSSNGSVSTNKYSELGVGVNPLLGINFFITPHLSVGTEVKFTAEYISGKVTYSNSSNNIENENKISGFRTRFGPLGYLSVNIHL